MRDLVNDIIDAGDENTLSYLRWIRWSNLEAAKEQLGDDKVPGDGTLDRYPLFVTPPSQLALPDGVALDVVTGELDGISRDGATASIRLDALRALTASWQLLYPGAMGRQTLLRRLLEPGTPSELLDGLAADATFCASLAADVLGSDGETDVRVGDGSAAMIKLMKTCDAARLRTPPTNGQGEGEGGRGRYYGRRRRRRGSAACAAHTSLGRPVQRAACHGGGARSLPEGARGGGGDGAGAS